MQRATENKCVSKTFVFQYLVQNISLYNSCFLQTNVFFYMSTKPLREDTTLSQEENISFYKTYDF